MKYLTIIIVILIINGCSTTPNVSSSGIQNVPSACKKLVLTGGNDDTFGGGVDIPSPRAQILSALGPPPRPANDRTYDVGGINNSLVESFEWGRLAQFPHEITDATLTIYAKPESGDLESNDNIQLYPYAATQSGGRLVGVNIGRVGNVNGVLSQPWTVNNYQVRQVIEIDLKNFPSHKYNSGHGSDLFDLTQNIDEPSGVCPFDPSSTNSGFQKDGTYDLRKVLNRLGYLDVFIGDDTNVDYMTLTLYSCTCS